MPYDNNHSGTEDSGVRSLTPGQLRRLLKQIGNLNRTGMKAGNTGNFDQAFLNLEDALSLSRDLGKACLEAKLLNNLGILYTQSGAWDKAMLTYDRSLNMVIDHHGTRNFLYKTLQKNIGTLFKLDMERTQ